MRRGKPPVALQRPCSARTHSIAGYGLAAVAFVSVCLLGVVPMAAIVPMGIAVMAGSELEKAKQARAQNDQALPRGGAQETPK